MMLRAGRKPSSIVDDLATLPNLNEKIILEQICTRYTRDLIYTYVGDILVAVNPFKTLEIFSKNVSKQYKMVAMSALPPHIYAVADSAYQAMILPRHDASPNQCVIISGESGAGKTESTKLIIGQLIELSKGTSQLEQQILQVNPLLEAFGNARTLMNDNSSRFGKYIQLKFKDGTVMGAKISEYLLEKSRVVTQNAGEENFHIFYYMFAGLTPQQCDQYHLGKPNTYRYLSHGLASLKKGFRKNQDMFNDLLNALDMVGFTEEEQDGMFSVLASILNLGNIAISKDEDDASYIEVAHPGSPVQVAATMLGVDYERLMDVLTTSTTVTRGSRIRRNLTKQQAEDIRDATAKSLYGRLFGWIVNKINQMLAPPLLDDQSTEIGILDIFGFEYFEHNSFEQMCINLANEQLQFFFNQHIFMAEQEEYKREGIPWDGIRFSDNKPVLDMFLGRPIGILSLLDEESHFPQSTDNTFVSKINQNFNTNDFFKRSKDTRSNCFLVTHFAGKVEYNATGFLEKNRDTLPTGVTDMLCKSDKDLISKIFSGTITRTGTLALQGRISKGKKIRRTKKLSKTRQFISNTKKLTVGSQFKNSLTVLVEKMTAAMPHFVRCIKPNKEKVGNKFDEDYVRAQLRYTGVLETTRIRKEGFPIRIPIEDFVDMYRILTVDSWLPINDTGCREILSKAGLTDWHVGNTKVFLKSWHADVLTAKIEKVEQSVVQMQRWTRGHLARKKVRPLLAAARAQAEETRRFLQKINLSIVGPLRRQSDLLQYDVPTRQDIRRATLKKEKDYAPIEFFFPPPPDLPPPDLEEDDAPPPPPRGSSLNKFAEEEWNSGDEDEGDHGDDLQLEDDVFINDSNNNTEAFGRRGTKHAAVQWFQKTQVPRGAVLESNGNYCEWFHGIITRRRAEDLLDNGPVGCFLIRVSQTRFGYSLSFRSSLRCKHYIIEQTASGKYVIIGMPRVHKTLQSLVEHHTKIPLNDEGDLLTIACGQESNDDADYVDLIHGLDQMQLRANKAKSKDQELEPPPLPPKRSASSASSLPPPLPRRNYYPNVK